MPSAEESAVGMSSAEEYHEQGAEKDAEPKAPAQRQIPLQLLLTGKYAALEDLPPDALKNVQANLRKSPGLSLRYLNNTGCRNFLRDNFDNDLVQLFDMEDHGSFRGDICRTAVLSKEGGFYIDLDFELHVDMNKLVDPETTLMTVVTGTQGDPEILNALIAVKPNSSVMSETMANIRDWYKGNREGLLGPSTMAAAITNAMDRNCPSQASLSEVGKTLKDQWSCGSENFRFYKEDYFGDGGECYKEDYLGEGSVVCPPAR